MRDVPWSATAHSARVPCHEAGCRVVLLPRSKLCVCTQSGAAHWCDGNDCPKMIRTRESRVCAVTGLAFAAGRASVKEVDWVRTQREPKPRRPASEPRKWVPPRMRVKQARGVPQCRASRINDVKQWEDNHDAIRTHILDVLGVVRLPETSMGPWVQACEVQWVALSTRGAPRITLANLVLAVLMWMVPGLSMPDGSPWIAACPTMAALLPGPRALKKRFRITQIKSAFQHAIREWFVHPRKGQAALAAAEKRVAMFYRL